MGEMFALGGFGKRVAVMAVVCGFLLPLWSSPSAAATFRPLTFDDLPLGFCWPDPCSLREAVIWSEQNGWSWDRIQLEAGTYTLTQASLGNDTPATGDLDIAKYLTIEGAGAGKTVIDANGIDRAFDIKASGSVNLRGISIRNGVADFDPDTGHNHGGGIHNHGQLSLENSALVGNVVPDVPNPFRGGGALANAPTGFAVLQNVTIVLNGTARGAGGGIENKGMLSLIHTTIADNGPDGLAALGGSAELRNTIVAYNPSVGGGVTACTGTAITSHGNNLDNDDSCAFVGPPAFTDRPNADPKFGRPWMDPAQYPYLYPLLFGSPAIDAGQPGPWTNDEVGTVRPLDGNLDGIAVTDIGAHEYLPGPYVVEPPPPICCTIVGP